MTTNIRLLSDLHTESADFHYTSISEDILVLAGDIFVGKNDQFMDTLPKDIPVVFVAGNHEYYKHDFDEVNAYLANKYAGTNIHFLQNEQVIIDGIRFLGGTMYTNFELYGKQEQWFAEQAAKAIADFTLIRKNGRPWTVEDHKAEYEKFAKFLRFYLHEPFEGKTVVVTHFAAHERGISSRFKGSLINPFFTNNCEEFFGLCDLWLHGHTHDALDYGMYGTRVVCNPRGYFHETKNGFKRERILAI